MRYRKCSEIDGALFSNHGIIGNLDSSVGRQYGIERRHAQRSTAFYGLFTINWDIDSAQAKTGKDASVLRRNRRSSRDLHNNRLEEYIK